MAELGINPGFLIAQIVNFLVLLFTASRMWNRIADTLDSRSARIAEGLKNAEEAEQNLANAQAVYDEKLAEADRVVQHKILEAEAKADEAAAAIRLEAEAEAEKIRSHAREDAEAERDLVLAEMRGQVAALAIAAANKLVGEAMDEKRQQALVADFFAKVPAEVVETDGEKVEITSALPLTDAEKQSAQDAVGADDVTFKVDPSILGGLIVRSGDRVVDGSHLGQLQKMRERLQ